MIERPIIFTIDSNYVQHLAVALESLYSNNAFKFETYVFYDGLGSQDIKNLESIATKFAQIIEFREVDVKLFEHFKTDFHFTSAMYFRLLIPDVLDRDIHSAIYMDADIVVNGNIKFLFDLNLRNNNLAAIGNPNSLAAMRRLGLPLNNVYFDSGLLVFNLDVFRQTKLHKKVIEYIRDTPEKLIYPDNDALNILINGDFVEISPIYGLQSNYISNEKSDFSYFKKFGSIEEIFNSPLVIQYAGGLKPWHYMSNDYYKNLYWKYLKSTPYSNYKYNDKTLKNMVKKLVYLPIKNLINKVR